MKVTPANAGVTYVTYEGNTLKLTRSLPSDGIAQITRAVTDEEAKLLKTIEQLTEMSDSIFRQIADSQKDDYNEDTDTSDRS